MSCADAVTRLEAANLAVHREPQGFVAYPFDAGEAAEVLRLAAEAGARVVPTGLSSKLTHCRPEIGRPEVSAERGPLLLSTRQMDQLVEYVPGDGTLTAQAGAPMASLAETVAAGGHRLTPRVPWPQRATLGGVLGAGQSGLDRQRLGPLRHHVLGVTALLADGTTARSGGRLVKNVTGFDLHRLYAGSRGTLALLLEASLRLFPEPEAERGFACACPGLEAGLELAIQVLRLELPADLLALEHSPGEDGGWTLHLVLAGRAAHLDAVQPQLPAPLAEAEPLTGEALAQARRALEEGGHPQPTWPSLRLHARAPQAAAPLAAVLGTLERMDPAPRVLAQPGQGLTDLWLDPDPELPSGDRRAALHRARQVAAEQGARLEARALPADLHLAWAQPGRDLARQWMGALARELDPEGRFACPSFPVQAP